MGFTAKMSLLDKNGVDGNLFYLLDTYIFLNRFIYLIFMLFHSFLQVSPGLTNVYSFTIKAIKYQIGLNVSCKSV